MSQLIRYFDGTALPDIETLTGDVGGAVGPDAAFDIDILGGNNITTTGNPGANSITIAVTGTTTNTVQIGNATGSLTSLAAATDGQLVIGSTGAAPAVAALTAGANIGVTNGAGTITLAVNGTTDHTIQVGNAAGSLTSLAAATDGQIAIGSTGVDPAIAAITPGAGITVTNGAGSITIAQAADAYSIVTGQTIGAVTDDIFTFILGADEAITIFATITGTLSDYSAALGGTLNGIARKDGAAGAALVGAPIASFSEDSAGAPDIDIVVAGNNAIVRVTGVAAETWNWRAQIHYVYQTV